MKLTDMQAAVLIAAAARADGAILPLPAQIRGGAIGKVCDALMAKGLALDVGPASTHMLVISDDGRRALGLEIMPTAATETKPPQGRAGTKQAQLIAMLEAPEGVASRRSSPPSVGSHTRFAAPLPERSRKARLADRVRDDRGAWTRLPHHAVSARTRVGAIIEQREMLFASLPAQHRRAYPAAVCAGRLGFRTAAPRSRLDLCRGR